MDMKTLMKVTSADERKALAAKVGSTVNYFWQLAGGHKNPSSALSKKLVKAEPRLTLPELRPDIWDVPVSRGNRKEDRIT